ncbi:TerD family protein [Heyndrickxia sporothermodurans]
MENEIYLRRKNKLILEPSTNDSTNDPQIATIIKNIEEFGYTLSENVINTLKTYSIQQLEGFYTRLIKDLGQMIGANKNFSPMYPNFPKQVMDASESELYLNAVIHYLTNGRLLPEYEKNVRVPLFDKIEINIIDLGSKEEFFSIFINLLASKTSLSETDKKDIEWIFKDNLLQIPSILPNEIPLKENIALVSKLILEYQLDTNLLFPYFKTPTDVLRLCVAISDGDISLAENTRFKSFRRKERRLIMGLLENCSNLEEGMKKYKNRWIRLGERLHPFEFKQLYPRTQTAFRKIRNNEQIETFNSQLVKAIKQKDFHTAINLLKQRPGEFARKLDYLLREHPHPFVVVEEFEKIAASISTTVLLQVINHFKNRNSEKDIRVFFPKGNISKLFAIDNGLPKLDEDICQTIIQICESTLVNMFSKRDSLGKVYIDEALKDYVVTFSQRSANKSLRSIVRGSKIDIPNDAKTIRSFIYWKEPQNDRVDIDLSAVIYSEKWEYLEHISYTNLRSGKLVAYHSGDITSAPNGASEFIDIDIHSVQRSGGRYVVFSIHSFSDQVFSEVPECFIGWMLRQYPNSGEVFEPKTVEDKIDVTSSTKIGIPMIVDLYENKIIWADIALKSNPRYYNNVEGNQMGMILIGKALTTMNKTNLYDLLQLHVQARGEICHNKGEADIIFSVDDGITPFDQDVFVSQYI